MSSKISAESVIERLKQLFEVKTDQELAGILGVSKPTISSWRQRNSVSHTICIQISQEKNISLDWLLAGEGAMLKTNGDNIAAAANDSVANREARVVLDMYLSLDDSARRDIFSAIRDKKFICEMRKRLEQEVNEQKVA